MGPFPVPFIFNEFPIKFHSTFSQFSDNFQLALGQLFINFWSIFRKNLVTILHWLNPYPPLIIRRFENIYFGPPRLSLAHSLTLFTSEEQHVSSIMRNKVICKKGESRASIFQAADSRKLVKFICIYL